MKFIFEAATTVWGLTALIFACAYKSQESIAFCCLAILAYLVSRDIK